MLLTILGVIALVIVIVLAVAATRPDTFRVERSGSTQAPPEKVFALIEDFHQWTSWSPWEHLDPDLKRTYGGAEKGKGATYAWHGNAKAGEGRMEIDFEKPFEAHNQVDFAIKGEGGGFNLLTGGRGYFARASGSMP